VSIARQRRHISVVKHHQSSQGGISGGRQAPLDAFRKHLLLLIVSIFQAHSQNKNCTIVLCGDVIPLSIGEAAEDNQNQPKYLSSIVRVCDDNSSLRMQMKLCCVTYYSCFLALTISFKIEEFFYSKLNVMP
jgi:hypothetical protein